MSSNAFFANSEQKTLREAKHECGKKDKNKSAFEIIRRVLRIIDFDGAHHVNNKYQFHRKLKPRGFNPYGWE
jgi:hypothetical protein